MEEIRFDVVHVAMFSPRPGTIAGDKMPDLLTWAEKKDRLHRVEALQERISLELNRSVVGSIQEVLVEDQDKGKWKGRNRANKLVFFEDERNWLGRLALVRIDRASAWSLQGSATGGEEPAAVARTMRPLPMLAVR
jgi:tRNA-2-methylthio-N6-dimethylallyladenosine synthase